MYVINLRELEIKHLVALDAAVRQQLQDLGDLQAKED